MQREVRFPIGSFVYHKTADAGKGIITGLLIKESTIEYYIEWFNGDRMYYDEVAIQEDEGYDPKLLDNGSNF